MRISELEIGEFYIIKSTTKKKVVVKNSQSRSRLVLTDHIDKEDMIHKESFFQYLGKTTEKIEKRVDSKRKEVYTYRPHTMLCLKTGLIYLISGYYIQTYFIKPKK